MTKVVQEFYVICMNGDGTNKQANSTNEGTHIQNSTLDNHNKYSRFVDTLLCH